MSGCNLHAHGPKRLGVRRQSPRVPHSTPHTYPQDVYRQRVREGGLTKSCDTCAAVHYVATVSSSTINGSIPFRCMHCEPHMSFASFRCMLDVPHISFVWFVQMGQGCPCPSPFISHLFQRALTREPLSRPPLSSPGLVTRRGHPVLLAQKDN